MTKNEFIEFYGGTQYVKKRLQDRSFLNTDRIQDIRNYGATIFRSALQHLAHDRAADVVCKRVFQDALRCEFEPLNTEVLEFFCSKKWQFEEMRDDMDARIWNKAGEFPGLYFLTHARSLEVLVESPPSILLTEPHPDVYTAASPSPWFLAAAPPLRQNSESEGDGELLYFRAASMLVHYKDEITPKWVANSLGISNTVLNDEVIPQIQQIIEPILEKLASESEKKSLFLRSVGDQLINYSKV